MLNNKINSQINKKKSFLCVGLDIDIKRIPKSLLEYDDPIFEFAKQIIDSTNKYAIAYKPNIAFFEAHGVDGYKSLEKISKYLKNNYNDIFTIADAKRGDIGNTSKMYASAFLNDLDFDSITVSPYMGSDSVEPFLTFDNKYVFLLALTSNKGSEDFQELFLDDNSGKLYEKVINVSKKWRNNDKIMYVVGAKNTKEIKKIRKLAPNSYLLIPGLGAQGGNLKEICKYGLDKDFKLIINSSRSIIYASSNDDFAEKAALEAKKIQNEMESYINKL
ncbi:MAG: orotidine-5'-phosphate decarboxylase [Cryomorphaceae bacterium]|jgi:orotidine-5'-phosphate decarboxylase|nr:orotidine-5'-phosphate decarboxylase [Cryomorphaceae bacterium]MBT3503428.1 orotidine-5'-phosphate decarboxylase [Cryomorphaceae bacterium]MBT3688666.1 orotidine-5'-phosphate decarboxylase [Cryomorphaceae bacterium]MBT4222273.1 orotidine-5'-phosphate decarboxylase [Cryomorphaceae bacterium]MBT4517686.1 orotidine-5'-phosphate decarboxylase [Cryomorphaceae bacterium]